MTDALKSNEALGRAAFGEKPSGGTLSAEQQAAVVITGEMDQKGPRAALKIMVDHEALTRKTEEHFAGTDIDPATGKRGLSTEQSAQGSKDTYVEQQGKITKFLEEGYDKLDPADKTRVMTAMYTRMNETDAGKAFLASFGTGATADAERKAAMERLLKSGQYQDMLKGNFDALTAQESHGVKRVDEAKHRLEAAERAVEAKIKEKEVKDREHAAAIAAASRFEGSNDLATELSTLEGEEQTLIADKGKKAAEQKTLKDQVAALKEARAAAAKLNDEPKAKDLNDKIVALSERMGTLASESAESDAKLLRLNKLRDQKAQAAKDQGAKELEASKADQAVRAAEADVHLRKVEVQDALDAKLSAERGRAETMAKLIEKTTVDFVDQRVSDAEQAQKKALENEIKNMTDKSEQSFGEHLGVRWNKKDKYGNATFKTDNNATGAEMNFILQSGADSALEQALIDSRVTDDERKAIMADPARRKEYKDLMLSQLLTKRINSGKLTDNEASFFFSTPDGKSALNKAISENDGLKKQLGEMHKKGDIKDINDFINKIGKKEVVGGSLAALLFLLLGPLGLAAGVGVGAIMLSGKMNG